MGGAVGPFRSGSFSPETEPLQARLLASAGSFTASCSGPCKRSALWSHILGIGYAPMNHEWLS